MSKRNACWLFETDSDGSEGMEVKRRRKVCVSHDESSTCSDPEMEVKAGRALENCLVDLYERG
eukprot:3101659-Amphidinium_carterae.1